MAKRREDSAIERFAFVGDVHAEDTLLAVALDVISKLAIDVVADPDVLDEVSRELLLPGVPVRLPFAGDGHGALVANAHAQPAGMNLLTH